MAKCIDLINDSFYSLGVTSDINPSSPELVTAAFRRFLQWLNQLAKDGVVIWPIDQSTGQPIIPDPLPSEPGDELGNDPAFDLALAAGFAPWVAPIYQVPVPLPAQGAADAAMDTLYTSSMLPDAPEWPETLPRGSGNVRGPKGRVFFPVPEYTKEQQGDTTTTP